MCATTAGRGHGLGSLKNAIALFSSEMSEGVSKSTSHPRTMRYIGQFDPVDSIPALGIEFRALLRHLPSGAPNRTTNAVLQNLKGKMR